MEGKRLYSKVSDLEILQYLVRSLPAVELLFIVQIVYASSHPWLSLLICICLPGLGPILTKIIQKSPSLNLNLVWLLACLLLMLLCIVSGADSPAWYFGISGTIAAAFVAQGQYFKTIAVIMTIVGTCLGCWLGGRSVMEILPIFTALTAFAVLFLRTYGFLSQINETIEKQSMTIQNDRDEIDRLLSNILPESIIHRLKSGEFPIADHFDFAAVLFADIVGFTQSASQISPIELVTALNVIFSNLDELADRYELEKIKMIGDAYMVVGGVPKNQPKALQSMAYLALDIQASVQNLKVKFPCQMRIGIHVGPLVAGVIGHHKFAYDLWGDTVNVASRLESSSLPGKIHCSHEVYEKLKTSFHFETRSPISIKGKGIMQTYFLMAPLSERSEPS
jgi:class 3 adenylate cyclase